MRTKQLTCFEYPHPKINSAETYILAVKEKGKKKGEERKGKKKAGGQGSGGPAFEAGKTQEGRGKERKSQK